MRFLYVKREQVCRYCGSTIDPGDEAVVLRIRRKNGSFSLVFLHTDQCFEQWTMASFVKRLYEWRESATKRNSRKKKKLGRPAVYINKEKARRLKASIWYHKNQGHTDKVEVLEMELINCRRSE